MSIVLIIVALVVVMFGFTIFFGAPFLPTRRKWAKSALKLANIKPTDVVVDLGSGSGIIMKLVAETSARAIGYELNPILVLISKIRLAKYGDKTKTTMSNYWRVDLPQNTTVIYIFPVARDEKKLIKYLEIQAKKVNAKKLRVISYGLPLGDKKPLASHDGANLYMF